MADERCSRFRHIILQGSLILLDSEQAHDNKACLLMCYVLSTRQGSRHLEAFGGKYRIDII